MLALIPVILVLGYFDFVSTIKIIITSVVSTSVIEALWNRYIKKTEFFTDLSPIVTGLILAVIMPSHVPVWIVLFGGIFAIIIVKMFFGGLGQNFMNPAAATKIFLITTWGTVMAKPMGSGVVDMASNVGHHNLFLTIAIIIGALFLVFRGVINILVPMAFIGMAVLTYLALGHAIAIPYTMVLVGVFMTNDYSSTPINLVGKVIFAALAGMLAALIILQGGNPEGPYFAIIILNLFSPMIEQLTTKKYSARRVS